MLAAALAAGGSSRRSQRTALEPAVNATRCYGCLTPRKHNTRFDKPPRKVTALMVQGMPLLAGGVERQAIICTVCRKSALQAAVTVMTAVAAAAAAAPAVPDVVVSSPTTTAVPAARTGALRKADADDASADALLRRKRRRSASPTATAAAASGTLVLSDAARRLASPILAAAQAAQPPAPAASSPPFKRQRTAGGVPLSLGHFIVSRANRLVRQLKSGQTLRQALDAARQELDEYGGLALQWETGTDVPPSHAVVQRMVAAWRADKSGRPHKADEVLFTQHDWTETGERDTEPAPVSAAAYVKRGKELSAAVGSDPLAGAAGVLDAIAAQMDGAARDRVRWPMATYMNGMQIWALSAAERRRRKQQRGVPRAAAGTVDVSDDTLTALDTAAGSRSSTTLHDQPPGQAALAGAFQPTAFISAGPAMFTSHTEAAGADGIIQYVEGAPKIVFCVPRRHWVSFQAFVVHRLHTRHGRSRAANGLSASYGVCFVPTAAEIERFDMAVLHIDAQHPIGVVGRWSWHWGFCTGPSVTLNCNVYAADKADALVQTMHYLFEHRQRLWTDLQDGKMDWSSFVDSITHLQQYHNSAVSWASAATDEHADIAVLPQQRPSNIASQLVPPNLAAAYGEWRRAGCPSYAAHTGAQVGAAGLPG